MARDKTRVRQIFSAVKAAGENSLTAPEGKPVCGAYGIAVLQQGAAAIIVKARKYKVNARIRSLCRAQSTSGPAARACCRSTQNKTQT